MLGCKIIKIKWMSKFLQIKKVKSIKRMFIFFDSLKFLMAQI